MIFAPEGPPIALTSASETGSDQATRFSRPNDPLRGERGSGDLRSSAASIDAPSSTSLAFATSCVGWVTASNVVRAVSTASRMAFPIGAKAGTSRALLRTFRRLFAGGIGCGRSDVVPKSSLHTTIAAVPSPMQWWMRMIRALPPSTSSTTWTCQSGRA